jgi:hypothetical protein
MYVIKIFSDFCSSEKAKENYETIYELQKKIQNLDPYKKVHFTAGNRYTHVILLNQAMPKLTIPKERVIGFAFEPYELMKITPPFVEYAKKHIHKYYIGSKHQLPEPFVEGFGFMWFANPGRCIPLFEKANVMSIIVSEKKFAPGHQYRHQLVEAIIQHQLPIDIYGRGSKSYATTHKDNDSDYHSTRIKGEFHDESPYENYMFSICIENFSNHHYFSEKIMSSMMYNCVPIYWGCTHISSYFDEPLLLTGDVTKDMNLLQEILKNPSFYYRETYHEKNKKTINLIENMDRLFV